VVLRERVEVAKRRSERGDVEVEYIVLDGRLRRSRFLLLDMYLVPQLRRFRYLWRLDQDVGFRACPAHDAACARDAKEGPFREIRERDASLIDLESVAFEVEHHPDVGDAGRVDASGLKAAAIAFAAARPTRFKT